MTEKPVRWRLPLLLSGVVLLSQSFPLPSAVRDAATLLSATHFHLVYPLWHLVFTPFCSVADALTLLSVHQLKAFVVTAILLFFILGGWIRGALMLGAFLVFIAWAVLIPRPMGRLVAEDPDLLLIDFHSHTQFSHDGRPSFTPEANMRWHAQQGYHAAFITDHNLIDAAERAKKESSETWQTTGYRSLEGEEVSLKKTHLVILGNRYAIDNKPFDSDPKKIPAFVAEMTKEGIPVIASIPEYWLYHWPGTAMAAMNGDINDFITWGMKGFEIVNSAPVALDFPLAYRAHIVDLCRSQNLFMTGISDNHGYGYATDAWNAMRIPGWALMDPDTLQAAVLRSLKDNGFSAVQVIERVKYFPQTWLQLLWSPWGNLLVYWRSLQMLQALVWVAWIWILFYPRLHFVE